MKKNFHYVITAIPANPNIKIANFASHFHNLKTEYNNHIVKNNPKEIDDIYLSSEIKNGVVFDFWSQNELPSSRELQSMRRISKALADINHSVVIGKDRVLISAKDNN